MQMPFRLLSVIALTVLTTFTACKKDSEPKPTDSENEMATHADDQSRISAEVDAVANDANIVAESNASFNGRYQSPTSVICDAVVVVDTANNQRQMTITYNGSSCYGHNTRSGTVVISMPAGTRWRDPGAVLTISYQNLNITRLADNKSITINGTGTITNVSGSRLVDLATQNSITHTLSSNINITFDNGAQRSWQMARKRVYTYHNGVVVTITGTHTEGNNSNIAEWGTTRFGEAFVTSITQPVVIRQDCNFRITSGQVQHEGPGGTATVTLGLDAHGTATSCPGSGSYYYKLSWTINGTTHQLLLPY